MTDKKPEEVFTPRESRVNRAMYIERPELEDKFKQGLRGGLHLIVHGESGTGKSWLYKKVLADLNAFTLPLNLANAARLGKIADEMHSALQRTGRATMTGYTETKSAEANAVVAKGSLANQRSYTVGAKEPFEACCEHARSEAGSSRVACIVLDNLESIFQSSDLMEELANMIILLDDERYAAHRVRLIIVGVPTGIRDYFGRTPHRSTVANRLHELSEVGRLTRDQASQLIRTGFVNELGYSLSETDMLSIIQHVSFVTDRIPQRIHEYCLGLALQGESTRSIDLNMLLVADKNWLESSLSAAYSAIEQLMNERDTRIGRRNQTIYVIGHCDKSEFRYSDVEDMIRGEFPNSTRGVTMDCSTLLARLASGDTPILRRTPKGDSYQFSDPKYRMCIRAMLTKASDESIEKVQVSNIA